MSRASSVVESSLIVCVTSAIATRAAQYARTSRLAGAWVAWSGYWMAFSHNERTLVWGVALTSAAVVHVAARVVQGAPPDWLWLIVPGIVASLGLLLLTFGRRAKLRS